MGIDFRCEFIATETFDILPGEQKREDRFPQTSDCLNGSYNTTDGKVVFWDKVCSLDLGRDRRLRSITGEKDCGELELTPIEFINWLECADHPYFSHRAAIALAQDLGKGWIVISWA